MSPTIQAIPTTWKGFTFRSRLEARWAIFLDAIGVKAYYEPEAWKMPDGTEYLPDFYFPIVRMWAEVKPNLLTQKERWKAESLVRHRKESILLLQGPPDFMSYEGICFDSGECTSAEFSLDLGTGKNRQYYHDQHRFFCWPILHQCNESDFSAEYIAAVYASRSEQFNDWRG